MKLLFKQLIGVVLVLCSLYPFINSSSLKNKSKDQWPLVAVVIMVKNEEAVIQPTLLPYIKAGVDAFLVFDTGSTDKTMLKAQELFDQHNIKNGYIIQEPFIDFSTSRNRALDIAEEKFPNAVFYCMPDAEWYLENAEGFMNYCAQEALNLRYGAYFVRIYNTMIDFYVPRLLTRKYHPRFIGVVHEAIPVTVEQSQYARLDASVFFSLQPSHFGLVKSKERWLRDRDLLLKEYNKDPNNAHTTFYLAQTYESLNDYKNAFKFYEIRANQPTLGEEDDFFALYKYGLMADFLMPSDSYITWDFVMGLYLKAYEKRPWRAEPLIKITEHYMKEKSMATAFIFAKRAIEIPYPSKERMFVEKELYDFTRYDLTSVCAWEVGEFEIGKQCALNALKVHPESTQLQNNLHAYEAHENKKDVTYA